MTFAMSPSSTYIGTWHLVPELSIYELGVAPACCTYTITATSTCVQIHVQWQTEFGGQPQEVRFGGPIDGKERPLFEADESGLKTLVLSSPSLNKLDSTVYERGVVVASARRVASWDGALLAIAQEQTDATGATRRSFQVYRRAGSDDCR